VKTQKADPSPVTDLMGQYLNVEEVARVFRIKPKTLQNWLCKGRDPNNVILPTPSTVGRVRLFQRKEIEGYLARARR
jgi:hypothetical protein